MSKRTYDPSILNFATDTVDGIIEIRRQEALLKAGALQNAIFNSANFSSIATDANGVIQIFNVGAEQMLGYAANDVINKVTPAEISDPQEVIARAEELSIELGTPITPGFEALVFKASRGIEDIYELTYIRKDGSRFPAVVSVTALRDDQYAIIGYLLIGTDNSARKRAEEALLKAGALQSAIFNSANFSSIATDAKGVIQIFNVGAERMLGYAATDVMNKITPADISDPQEVIVRAEALSLELDTPILPGFEALVFKASRGIEDIYELTYIRKDGSRFPAIVSVTALRDAEDAIIGYLLIGTDNTARKQAEEALLKAGALQKAIFNSANFSSIATDAKGVIQIFNVGAERMLGYAAADVMNKITPAEISDPQEVIARAEELSVELGTPITPGFEALVFKASRGIEDIYELTYIRKDGSRFPAVVSVTALRDDHDAIIGYLLIGTDNTERKKAEESIQAAAEYARSLIEASLDPLMMISAQGKITDVNAATEQVSGVPRIQLIGSDFADYFTDPGKAREGYQQVFSQGSVTDYPLAIRHVSGKVTEVLYNSSLYRDGNGNVLGVFAAARDITERKRAEETAQAALLAKSQFLANMSHEIRTPLNAILGLTRIVMESELKPEQREQLDKVRRSGRALVRIIDDILDFSRVEAGRLAIERIPMRVEAALLEVVELLGLQAEEKGLELFLDIDQHTPLLVMGDPFRLVQILNNLVGNAIKFTHHGDIHISVRVEQQGETTNTLRFNVRDTGIGIAPDQIGVLFQPFSQADSSTTRKFGGSGLGLAIVTKLVELLGGQITLDSTVGKGTNVSFTIKVGIASEDQRNVAQMGFDSLQMTGKRVLVVDDQATSRQILALLLKAWGMEVIEAENGEQALARVAEANNTKQLFHAVLLDWRMPGMNGLEVAVELRAKEQANGQTAPLPILMVTADSRQALLQQPEANCINGVLTKPVIPSRLFNALLHGEIRSLPAVKEPHTQRFDGIRVLLVEDNELNQEVAASILRKRGATLTIAWNGVEAVALVQQQAFDLVLMDLHMPIMGGIEATRQIRELAQGKKLPIVAMTAAVMTEDRERCMAIGMVDFIPKPVEPEDIVRVLHTYTQAGAESLPAILPTIQEGWPVFDWVTGLSRLDGDHALQHRLLLSFIEAYHDSSQGLDALLIENNSPDAIELIHAVKGVASNLSAVALTEASRRLLEELRIEAPLTSRAPFDAILLETLVQMRQHLSDHEQSGRIIAKVKAPMPLNNALLSLEPFIISQEIIPDALLMHLQQLANADEFYSPLLRTLQQQIDSFEHPEAVATLKLLKNLYLEH